MDSSFSDSTLMAQLSRVRYAPREHSLDEQLYFSGSELESDKSSVSFNGR